MKNNMIALLPLNDGDQRVVRSRNRLIRLYNQLRDRGGWRAVAKARGSKNQQYIYNFAMHGIEPRNLVERKACFLPARICEMCKRPVRSIGTKYEHKEIPGWMKQWKKLPKEQRDEVIYKFITKQGEYHAGL